MFSQIKLGGGVDSTPLPSPSKLGVFNTPSKLRLRGLASIVMKIDHFLHKFKCSISFCQREKKQFFYWVTLCKIRTWVFFSSVRSVFPWRTDPVPFSFVKPNRSWAATAAATERGEKYKSGNPYRAGRIYNNNKLQGKQLFLQNKTFIFQSVPFQEIRSAKYRRAMWKIICFVSGRIRIVFAFRIWITRSKHIPSLLIP